MATAKKSRVDLTTGEIQEEIEARVNHRLHSDFYIREPHSRVRLALSSDEPSMTHQSHAESCDINNIIRQFDRTGVLPPATRQGQYGDVSNLNKPLTDLINDSIEASFKAREAFARDADAQKEIADKIEQSKPSAESPAAPPPPSPDV